jgi:hypothetical protein
MTLRVNDIKLPLDHAEGDLGAGEAVVERKDASPDERANGLVLVARLPRHENLACHPQLAAHREDG